MESNGTADAFDLIDWINSGTEGRREVVLYNDPGLVLEYERLSEDRSQLLRESAADPEQGLGEESALSRIEAQMEDLYDRFQASRSVWTVRALTDEEIRGIHERLPIADGPQEPREPKSSPKGSQAWHEYRRALAEYKVALDKHLTATQGVIDDRNLHVLAAAVVMVETAAGTAHGVTYEQMKAMRASHYGKVRTDRLIAEVSDLTTNEPVIPAPKSRAPRLSSQD